ncbi:sulfite exporter TauE/SafE family protein [Vallicoccus soli]|uniref:Probable membrane transporter protein n=1 Tax=Vallicoccus soli TaxID=2339232 RepID=A0A3A3YUL2_9ACTN|nr:sulfite exporter TauE/SafE family protein [Vallicoccus soli]RJK93492.1 sulfite exporter TauE/SafE family protein [Vallicoccus soli]
MPVEPLLLALAGLAAGFVSVVVGLASLVSYPALLAAGLPPVAANVTNTVSLTAAGIGATLGSRVELAGQGRRMRRMAVLSALGGATGAALLLTTPADAFEALVPVLVGGASLALLLQPRLRRLQAGHHHLREEGPLVMAGVYCVAVYGGYFGAAAGVLMLALLAAASDEALHRLNAAKNTAAGVANAVASLAFVALGPVDWSAAVPLALGFLAGGSVGPAVARRVPQDVLRYAVCTAGIGLALVLAVQTYG